MNIFLTHQSHVHPVYTALSTVALAFAFIKVVLGIARYQTGDSSSMLKSITSAGFLFIAISQFQEWLGLAQEMANGLVDLVNANPAENHREFARLVTNSLEGEDVGGLDVFRAGGLTKLVTYWFVLFLGTIAMGIVWLGEVVQGVAMLLGASIAPLMLSSIMLDSTRGTGVRYVIGMVALALVPVAWAVMDIGTGILLEWAADSSDGFTTVFKNAGAVVALTLYILIATILAPIAFYRQLTSGGAFGISMIQGFLSSASTGASYAFGAGTAVHSAGGSKAATAATSAAAGASGLASGAIGGGGMLVPAIIGSAAILTTTKATSATSESPSSHKDINQQAADMAAKYKTDKP